jgi:predicted transcriptional regulator of viral defense system
MGPGPCAGAVREIGRIAAGVWMGGFYRDAPSEGRHPVLMTKTSALFSNCRRFGLPWAMEKRAFQDGTDAEAQLGTVFRPRDLEAAGIPRSRLRSWLHQGTVELVGRGLYRITSAQPTEHETVVRVATRAPNAIICLLTALRMHDLGTQAPREVWIALDRKARKPELAGLPVHVVRFSGPMLTYGVETREIQGVSVRITSPARTVVDCFRYRNKVGLDVALEALRDALGSRRASAAEILRIAEVGRVRGVILPYVEAIVS